jgi:hypothetical protein
MTKFKTFIQLAILLVGVYAEEVAAEAAAGETADAVFEIGKNAQIVTI